MPQYQAPLSDMHFVLHDWLNISQHYQSIGAEDIDAELVNEILNQGSKFAEEVLAPLNREGDEQSCKLVNGKVTTPHGFASAYQEYIANGWNAMLGSEEYGGQNLPFSLAVPVHEMNNAANLSWRLICMLTESAILAMSKHASEQLKNDYLPKLISGEWTGTMCLTEPQAGSDLGLLSCKAVPNDEGSFNISGSKIFISGGDQDWSSNVIHLVLARLPDAPAGPKGISLFLVPKFLLDAKGKPAQRNAASVGSLEKKMGLKACPTCVMNFDSAKGYLVGETNKGLACMFTMMNDARFQVGLQGLGISEAAYQGSLLYARERLQSRAPQGPQQPEDKADAILHQPDVRRMLLTQKALSEGCRALAYLYAQQMDVEKFGKGEEKQQAAKVLAFLTPIAKSFMTDMGQEVSQLGVQIYGGHGYIREWGMEQLIRDSRITQLYEGTNGIQAVDLITRKLARDGGDMLQACFQLFSQKIQEIEDEKFSHKAELILSEWLQTSKSLMALDNTNLAAAAHDYLQYSAYSLLGVIWLSMADTASRSMQNSLKQGKVLTCDFFIKRILPRKDLHKLALNLGADDLLAIKGAEFDYK
jgi:alkylation response protein AidB-like acyl-CoA dehydrogenase